MSSVANQRTAFVIERYFDYEVNEHTTKDVAGPSNINLMNVVPRSTMNTNGRTEN